MPHIETVRGPLPIEELGVTLPHEHLLLDQRNWWHEPSDPRFRKYGNAKVKLENLQDVRRNSLGCRDNLVLDDVDLAVKELRYYKRAGGVSLVDLTMPGIGRDAARLRRISERTGINIVCGTGYYVQSSHPPEVEKSSVEQLAEGMISEITEGIAGTKVRAGIIGEIGVSPLKMHPNEAKVLRAAARAQKETGVPITIHSWPFNSERNVAAKVLDLLESCDADLKRVVLLHMDWARDTGEIARLAERGAFVQFSSFGADFPFLICDQIVPGTPVISMCDYERCVGVKELLAMGFIDRIQMSHDICMKIMIKKYGGWGYDHILVNTPPLFKMLDIGERDFTKIMVDNPRSMFAR